VIFLLSNIIGINRWIKNFIFPTPKLFSTWGCIHILSWFWFNSLFLFYLLNPIRIRIALIIWKFTIFGYLNSLFTWIIIYYLIISRFCLVFISPKRHLFFLFLFFLISIIWLINCLSIIIFDC